MDNLTRYRLFEGLDPQALADIARYAQLLHVQRGAVLFEEDMPAVRLYAIQNGWIRLYKLAVDGRQSVIRLSGPAEVVGISAVLPDVRYTLSAQTIVACRLMAWQADDLQHLIDRYPTLQSNSLRLLSEYRDALQQQLLELATEHVEQRLAHALIRLADHYGTPVDDPEHVALPLMQRDLADLIGVSHFSGHSADYVYRHYRRADCDIPGAAVCAAHAAPSASDHRPGRDAGAVRRNLRR